MRDGGFRNIGSIVSEHIDLFGSFSIFFSSTEPIGHGLHNSTLHIALVLSFVVSHQSVDQTKKTNIFSETNA